MFLKQAGAVVAAGLTLPGCNVLFRPDLRAVAGAMNGLLNRPRLAASIGRRYLNATGALVTASLETVTGSLLDDLGLNLDSLAYLSVNELRDRLAARIRTDFSEENVVIVDGWMLSRTECLLCAVAYLHP